MSNKTIRRFACWLIVCLLLIGSGTVYAKGTAVDEATGLIDGIVAYKRHQTGVGSTQQWIDHALTEGAGRTAEWYVLALAQSGQYDFSSYQKALLRYLSQNDIAAAASRQKYALLLIATGSSDAYIQRTLNDSIGQQGVMSWIYGLHLLNNGYHSDQHTTASVTKKLLSLQLSDGGWAVMGKSGDVDVTAMAVQALAPQYRTASVKTAIDKALHLLSSRQKSSGDFASYGVNNPESTAQVITALAALGIDGETDARFIKNGHTLLSAIRQYRLSDGSFCHKAGGDSNDTATVQVLYAMVAYRRMATGKSGLYILDQRHPTAATTAARATTAAPKGAAPVQTTVPRPGVASVPRASAATPTRGGNAVAGGTNASGASRAPTTGSTARISGGVAASATATAAASAGEAAITSTTAMSSSQPASAAGFPVKGWIIVGIWVLGAAVCVFLCVTKRRTVKNIVLIVAVATVATVAVALVQVQSVEDYYHTESSAASVGTVTISIRCDTIADRLETSHIPSDGVLLPSSTVALQEGDSVFDVLTRVCKQQRILIDNNGSGESIYIKGIGQIYEFDFGDLSGWMYAVNGQYPSVSCGEYRPQDGDTIEWRYTCNLGEDLS